MTIGLDDKIIRTPNVDFVPDKGGYGKVLFRCLTNNGNSISQIDGITGETDTCSAYLERCRRTAITLRSKGIQKGDIISISCYNHLNSSVPYIGALFIGAITANIDPTVTLEETIHLLKKVKPKMIFIEPQNIEHFEEAIKSVQIETELIIFGNSDKHTQFSEFLKESKEEESFVPVEIDDLNETAIIIFSSGSTGFPKGVCLSYFCLGCYCGAPEHAAPSNTVMLTFSSIYWISQVLMIIMGIKNNAPRVILPTFDENILWQVISKYKVNVMYMTPTPVHALMKMEVPSDADVSSVMGIFIGGGKLADYLFEGFQKLFPKAFILQGYGLTECSGGVLRFDLKKKHEKEKLYKSIGQAINGVSIKVVDVETEEAVGPNQPGELRVKARLQMTGYYGEDASDCWDSEGWFKTGDMVYYDEQKYFYYVERIKEMIKYRAAQVYPGVLEDVVLSHPKISTCVVIGVPNPVDGDHPTAIVVLKDANDTVTPEEIIKYVDDRVDNKSKLRGGVTIVKQLPQTTAGKLKRKLIKDLFRDGKL